MTKKNVWYYLDPDNLKDKPDTIHCARCKRKIKETMAFESFQSIIMHPNPDYPWFRLCDGLNDIKESKHLIGSDCLKKVIAEFGEMGIVSE